MGRATRQQVAAGVTAAPGEFDRGWGYLKASTETPFAVPPSTLVPQSKASSAPVLVAAVGSKRKASTGTLFAVPTSTLVPQSKANSAPVLVAAVGSKHKASTETLFAAPPSTLVPQSKASSAPVLVAAVGSKRKASTETLFAAPPSTLVPQSKTRVAMSRRCYLRQAVSLLLLAATIANAEKLVVLGETQVETFLTGAETTPARNGPDTVEVILEPFTLGEEFSISLTVQVGLPVKDTQKGPSTSAGCFLTIAFSDHVDEMALANIPPSVINGFSLCSYTPGNSIQLRFFDKNGQTYFLGSLPRGMLADGSKHDIGFSVKRSASTITYVIDGKVMSSRFYEEVPRFPRRAKGPVVLGCYPNPGMSQSGIIGSYSNIVINTDTSLPITEKFVAFEFNEVHGYGKCVPYSLDLVDEGVCQNYNTIGDPVYLTPQGFTVTSKALLDGGNTLGMFVSEDCRPSFMKYCCSQIVMPCMNYTHNGVTYSFPRPPCRSDCTSFMATCRESLVEAENIIHVVETMRQYGAPLYDTWCNMTVDGRCNLDPDAKECNYEQFNANSPIRYVDLFHNQESHPVEGMDLPDGGRIPCASNDKEYVAGIVNCPSGFAAYTGDETEDLCVFPCISFLFTSEQIDAQFDAYIGTGYVGVVSNTFLLVSFMVGKKKQGGLPGFVVLCACIGLLYSIVDTIPTSALKFDLPCSNGCVDEFCHGSSALCRIEQPSEYLLLSVFCILLSTILELYMKTVLMFSPRKVATRVNIFNGFATTVLVVLVILCFLADTDLMSTGSAEYRQLIVARDSFNCGPRYSSPAQEFVLLTLPFMVVCLALVSVTGGMILNILQIVKKNPGSNISTTVNRFGKIAGKLMLLALLISMLWLVRITVATSQKRIVEIFSEDSKRWADCTAAAQAMATWTSDVGGQVNECNAAPNAGEEMFNSNILMSFVKNMQACIVGLVWGSTGVAVIAKAIVVNAATKMSSAAFRMGVSSGVSSASKGGKVGPSSLSSGVASGVKRSSAPSSTSY